jgi:hypothetical protein
MNTLMKQFNNEIIETPETIGDLPFNIAIVTKANSGIMTKELSLDERGKLVKDGSRCAMGKGKLESVKQH